MLKLKELFIEITNQCLLNCRHCSSQASINNNECIPEKAITQLIDEGLPLGLEALSLSGGEPFLHSGYERIIRYAKKRLLRVCIYSCGVYASNESLISLPDKILCFLKEQNVEKIIFSLHGSNEGTHDYITGVKGSFIKTLESINKSISYGIETEVHFVPMKVNYHEIPTLVQYLELAGVKRISLLRLVLQGRCKENKHGLMIQSTNGVEIVRTVEELRKKHKNINIRLGAPFNCVNVNNTTPCSASQNKLLISASGEIFPCEAFKYLKGKMTKIYDYNLEHIWRKDRLLNLLRHFSAKDIEGCQGCILLEQCRGGCPGERMLFNGDIKTGPDPWCIIKYSNIGSSN